MSPRFSLRLIPLLVWFAFPLAIFAWLGWFAAPAKDDLCYALALQLGGFKNGWIHAISLDAPNYSFWQALKNNYLTWQGRYSSSSLLLLLGYLSPTQLLASYKLIPLSLLIGTVGASIHFINKLNLAYQLGWPLFSRIAIVILILSCFFVGLNAPNETLYWAAGAITYQLPLILLLLLGAELFVLFSPSKQEFPNKITNNLIRIQTIFFLILMIAGCNEIAMAVQSALFALLGLLSWQKRYAYLRRKILLFNAFSLMCALAVIVSPGNSLRENAMGFPPSTAYNLLINSIQWTAETLIQWTLNASLLISALIIILFSPPVSKKFARHAAIVSIIGIGFFWLATLPSFYENIKPYHRILTPLYAIFIAALMAAFFSQQRRIKGFFNHYLSVKKPTHRIFLFIVLLVGWSASLYSKTEFRQQISDAIIANDFYQEVAARYAKTERLKNQQLDEVTLPALKNQPSSLFVGDLGSTVDSDWWSNGCYAGYFRLKSVKSASAMQSAVVKQ